MKSIFAEQNKWKLWVAFFVIIVLLALLTPVILYSTTKFEKEITISEKYIRYRRRGSNYNVVAEDGTIYRIGNVWFKGDFNRADDYAKLKEGQTYKVTGYGVRVPFLDMYKTIYKIE